MSGETDLNVLLKNMRPYLNEHQYVFCSMDKAAYERLMIEPMGLFREAEGMSIIIDRRNADEAGISYNNVWALITLTVHSDLTAVGFLAVITSKLAAAKISVNAVSGYYHDHLFVPWEERDHVMSLLKE